MAIASQLNKVPRILDLLVAQGNLPSEAVASLLEATKDPQYAGKFVGEIAVEQELITTNKLKAGLVQQATQRAYAALADINEMIDRGLQPLPDLSDTPHFGNNNQVNDIIEPIERADALIAAANVAELITKLANKNPSLLPELQQGVVAAKNLTMAIGFSDPKQFPLSRANQWMDQAATALRSAANASGIDASITDRYIENRINNEISTGIGLTRAANLQQLQQGNSGMIR